MGRKKKYTGKALRAAVERYFDSISRDVRVMERVDSGNRDNKGHVIWTDVPVENKLGEPVIRTEFVEPPTVAGLCRALNIHRSTWAEYGDPEKHPELAPVFREAKETILGYLERELITRPGKDIRGVVFDLENNHGYAEKQTVAVGGVEDYLKKLAEQGKAVEF